MQCSPPSLGPPPLLKNVIINHHPNPLAHPPHKLLPDLAPPLRARVQHILLAGPRARAAGRTHEPQSHQGRELGQQLGRSALDLPFRDGVEDGEQALERERLRGQQPARWLFAACVIIVVVSIFGGVLFLSEAEREGERGGNMNGCRCK